MRRPSADATSSVPARTAVKSKTSWRRSDIQPCCNTSGGLPLLLCRRKLLLRLGLLDFAQPLLEALDCLSQARAELGKLRWTEEEQRQRKHHQDLAEPQPHHTPPAMSLMQTHSRAKVKSCRRRTANSPGGLNRGSGAEFSRLPGRFRYAGPVLLAL